MFPGTLKSQAQSPDILPSVTYTRLLWDSAPGRRRAMGMLPAQEAIPEFVYPFFILFCFIFVNLSCHTETVSQTNYFVSVTGEAAFCLLRP